MILNILQEITLFQARDSSMANNFLKRTSPLTSEKPQYISTTNRSTPPISIYLLNILSTTNGSTLIFQWFYATKSNTIDREQASIKKLMTDKLHEVGKKIQYTKLLCSKFYNHDNEDWLWQFLNLICNEKTVFMCTRSPSLCFTKQTIPR